MCDITLSRLPCQTPDYLPVRILGVVRPPVFPVEHLHHPLGHEPLEVAHEYDVVLSMVVYPALAALPGITALYPAGCLRVKDFVQRLPVDIAQDNAEVLAQRNVPIGMYDQVAVDALTPKPQLSLLPGIIQSYEIVVLTRAMYVPRNATDIIPLCAQHLVSGIEEIHGAIYTDTHIYAMVPGHVYHVFHILKVVPRRQAEHQAHGHNVFQCLDGLYHLVMTVTPPHADVTFLGSVEREIQIPGPVAAHAFNQFARSKGIGQEREVGMIVCKPVQYFLVLRMQDELASLQPYHGMWRDAPAAHDTLDCLQGEMLLRLLPDGAVPATRLTARRGIEHQRGQHLVTWPEHIVDVHQSIVHVVSQFIHSVLFVLVGSVTIDTGQNSKTAYGGYVYQVIRTPTGNVTCHGYLVHMVRVVPPAGMYQFRVGCA